MKRFLGIVPKLFDSVDIAFFNRENMYNCRKIVDKNPRAAAKTFCMRGANADGFDDFFLDAVGDTRNVGVEVPVQMMKKSVLASLISRRSSSTMSRPLMFCMASTIAALMVVDWWVTGVSAADFVFLRLKRILLKKVEKLCDNTKNWG